MATVAYLDIDQGSDYTVRMDLETDDGNLLDLTNHQVYSQFRKSYSSVIGYTFTAEVVDAVNGVIELSLAGVDSSLIKPGRYMYDVEIVHTTTNRKTRVVEGIVTINPEITKIP